MTMSHWSIDVHYGQSHIVMLLLAGLQIKCCLLMLDFDSDDMVCDLFKVMLDTVK